MNTSPKIEPLTGAESAWISTQLKNAEDLVGKLSPEDVGKPITIEILDRMFTNWLSSGKDSGDASAVNHVINAIGVTFGRLLVEGLGLRWVIAIDEHGSDLAVYGLPGSADVVIYPANFVAKRWQRGETNFFKLSYTRFSMQLMKLRSERQVNHSGRSFEE